MIRKRFFACFLAAISTVLGSVSLAQEGGEDAARAAQLRALRELTTAQPAGSPRVERMSAEPIVTAACGDSWTAVAVPSSGTAWQAATWGGGLFIAVGTSGNISSSQEGLVWTPRNSGTSLQLEGVAYGNGAFVAVGKGGTILRSTDGTNWTAATSTATTDLNGVSYGNSGFIAVGAGGTILLSSNGSTWAPQSSPTTKDLYGVGFGSNAYVVVGGSSTILSSPDGAAWTPRVSPTFWTLYSVAWSGSTFAAVGNDGTILTSSDGITWADHSYYGDDFLNGVATGSGSLVTVGFDLTSTNLYITILNSTYGTSWSWRYVQWSGRGLNAVAYGGGQYIAVGTAGTILRSVCDGAVPPTASFTWSPTSPTVGQPIQFTDSSAGPPTTWAWTFGDGASSTAANPTHTFAAQGAYTVTLQVGNAHGTSSVSKNITVAPSGSAPVASFTWSPASPSTGQPVQFTDTSTGSPTAWEWHFGSTGMDYSQNPSFTFTAGGQYTVTLTASNAQGSSTATNTVTVVAPMLSQWVPVASHASGSNNSQWRTDLGLLNPGTIQANYEIRWHIGQSVLSSTGYVTPRGQSILGDVVAQLSGSGSGALEVRSDQPLTVTSRTYNLVAKASACYPNGTLGQDYPALSSADGLQAGETANLGQLVENATARSNIGILNTGAAVATVTVVLFNGAGAQLTSYGVALQPGEWRQDNRPFFTKAGQAAMDRGWASVTVNSGSGVFAFASVVDNVTNDPTTVPMCR
ncbi:MAG: PKD domain-containing protein [Thermoanaerobaculaceae bacterium]|nr:PKD domain-containing protein [Thermoanaerobaculaceae bacterium]MDI9621594.1 PKD domain-containing protein [Acidobacteriota bacterium]